MENTGKSHLPYKIVRTGGSSEIVEKKSRFIATLSPVNSEEEALLFIETMKKKYWDARHNCSAFVIGEDAQLTRCSDDKEPAGTAGKPMLEVLMGEEVRNTAVVVTRYFGGTLLGTGGLIRAYTQAVQAGLAQSEIVTMRYGTELLIETDYNGSGKIQYIAGQLGIDRLEISYTDMVHMKIIIPFELEKKFQTEITEATAGKALMSIGGKYYYPNS